MKPTIKKKITAVICVPFGILCLLVGLHTATFSGYDGDPDMPWISLGAGLFMLIMSYFLFTNKAPGLVPQTICMTLFTALAYGMTRATTGDSRYSVTDLHVIGWPCLVLFGSYTLLLLYRLLCRITHHTQSLQYDQNYFYLSGTLPIPWKAVKGFEQNTYGGNPNANVNVLVPDPRKYADKEKNVIRRWLFLINFRFGQPLYYNI